MTTITGVRRIRIISTDMTGDTVILDRYVRTGKRIETVIKGRWYPGRFRVTGLTVRWKLRRLVIRIRRVIVISLVTTNTSSWRIVVIPVMAGRTIIGDGGMCPIQLIISIVIREVCRLPVWLRRVAGRTIHR